MPYQGVLETTLSNYLSYSLHWNECYGTDGRSLINTVETEKLEADLASSAVIRNSLFVLLAQKRQRYMVVTAFPF